MDTEARNRQKLSKNLNKLRYNATACTTFEIAYYTEGGPQILTNATKSEDELLLWIHAQPPNTSGKLPAHRLRLIICPRISQAPHTALYHVPFSDSSVFEDIITTFHLPSTLLYLIFHRESHLSSVVSHQDTTNGWRAFLMRLAADSLGHHDLLLAIASNEAEGLTNAIMLGCAESGLPVPSIGHPVVFHDLKSIRTFLAFSKPSVAHPMLLLAMLADLQLKRFRERDIGIRGQVVEALAMARLSRRRGPGVITPTNFVSDNAKNESIDYDNITRDVLHLFTQSDHLTQAMIQFQRHLDKFALYLSAVDNSLSDERKKYLQAHGERIQWQIENIRDDIHTLIDKSRSTTEQTSLLMSSVWNLIAQQESRASQAIAKDSKSIAEQATLLAQDSKNIALSSVALAEDSRRIAAATKRDSTSMKAIAALTMVFLPFTFVATLFAMPIFDWQAKDGAPVLSSRSRHHFRIYWAAAIPLTIVVLLSWIIWILWSIAKQKREDEALEQRHMNRERTL